MPLSRAAHADVGDRLAADLALIFQAQVTTHQAQDLDDADARRVDADVLQDQFRTLGDTGGNQEEGCRGNVGRTSIWVALNLCPDSTLAVLPSTSTG